MKLTYDNENYTAQVVRVRHTVSLDGLDNLVGVPVLGHRAITSKDVEIDSLMLAFTAETRLSLEYAYRNSLFRHSELNFDPDAKGYLEDNRRVKAIKFRGNRSDALLMPLSSLYYIPGFDWRTLKEGDRFDSIDGNRICEKHVIKTRALNTEPQGRRRQEPRVDEKFFPKHFDTPNLYRNVDRIGEEDLLYVTQKLHGTSLRVANIPVKRKLKWYEKVAQKVGIQVKDTEYDYVYGSRNVVKDPNADDSANYYSTDIHTVAGRRFDGLLPKDYIVFAEIIGYVPNSAQHIQRDYVYDRLPGEYDVYVYRVATVNSDGVVTDLGWPAVKEFCKEIGVKHVPDIVEIYSFELDGLEDLEDLLDERFADHTDSAVPTAEGQVDEGFCIRVDGLRPRIYKAKSPKFLERESQLLDKGIEDAEVEA